MSAQPEAEENLEIVHILFIDAVGYSKLLISEQRKLLKDLSALVRSTTCFQKAEAAGKLIRLPTGDGMALVFADDPEAPVKCAVEVSRAAHKSGLPLRMGIHSGPVSRVVDVNDQVNVTGAGINTAQRVMSCGDAGHILLSKRAADDLTEYPHWHDSLRYIGECEVKHGIRLGLNNLIFDDVGNPELPARIRDQVKSRAALEATQRKLFRRRILAIAAVLLALVGFVAVYFGSRNNHAGSQVVSPKSIAVLPFLNLSDEKQNAYLADGIMDEVLTDLAKVADLRVISRTSVMQFRSDTVRNTREIAQALNVAHILEGSVQRSGDHVRINVQLIDARSDTHQWAEHYEGELADVFGFQSALAEKIVEQLRVRLSPQEKAAIEEKPTSDLVAYEYYMRAKNLYSTTTFNVHEKEKLYEMVQLLENAVAHDPAFFRAYYQLAWVNDRLYLLGIDHTPTRLALAGSAVSSVQRLQPNSGEAHLATAAHLYSGYRDYDRARQELALAAPVLPNEPLVFELTAYIDRRQGRWDQCIRNFNKAIELDPRNFFLLHQISLAYENMREFREMTASLDRALLLAPKDPTTQVQRALGELEWRGDPKPLHTAVELALREDPNIAAGLSDSWLILALCERDPAAATQAVLAMTSDSCRNEGIPLPRSWCEGLAARARGDSDGARAAFLAGKTEMDNAMRQQPDYGEALCVLGLFEAALGNKAEAISAGRRAVEILPISKDAINGPRVVEYLGLIYAWTGEKELAMDQLEVASRVPSDVNYGRLKLHPYWESLRGYPRFEKLVSSLAPK
jgi:TolB-like protein/Flp pilus assembly protein TadD